MTTLLFLGTSEDEQYSYLLKPMVGTATVYTKYTPIVTLTEVVLYCQKKGITGVFTTNQTLLEKLLFSLGNPKNNPSLDAYAGSYFKHSGIEFVIIPALKTIHTVNYASFLIRRYISKLVFPESWPSVPEFRWDILTPTNIQEVFNRYGEAYAISVDIETVKENLAIRCIGYTAIFISSSGVLTTHSSVLPIDSEFALTYMRKFNWELQAPKILQKGKYDHAYLARYNAPCYNYLWDTANLFHCWYSELPKDLGFLGAFFIREAMYWKDLANTSDLHEYYRYNALDTWNTACVWIAQIMQLPTWARENYLQEFPLQFSCHLSEMTGIKRDMQVLETAKEEISSLIVKDNVSLSKMLGIYPSTFNTNSAPQNAALRKILGCVDIKSSDEVHLKKIGFRHPLNGRITKKILDIRKNRKLESTYLTNGEKAKELNERILYALHSDGTDTGRLASAEHHFWCGLQIQNIPRGKLVKQTFVADSGFLFAEVDLKQAETRDTAYISGDKNLIAKVNSTQDFHASNASSFFGVPYESIYSDATGETIDKILRDLAKRTNHGANYLMGAVKMIDVMGEDKVWEAKRLLKLPSSYSLLQVTEYLLEQFHKTYPYLSAVFYPGVVAEVVTTHMLRGATGWTRYCFGHPDKNKQDRAALVAHSSQSLNAKVLNMAYMKVFYEIALHPDHSNNFKLCAQIHDSILFQFREGHEYLCDMVRKCMEIPVVVKGYDGITREFTVPADIKAGPDKKGTKYWSEL